MTQKEKLFYYLDRINNSTELKDEIYWKCGLEIWKPNELQDDFVMKGNGNSVVPNAKEWFKAEKSAIQPA